MRFWQSWRQLSKRVRERFRRPRPVLLQSATTYLLWQACVKQPALTHTPSPPKGREKKDATKMNFSSCCDHSWIKTTAIFSSLTFEYFFSADFFFFTAQTVGPMVHIFPLGMESNVLEGYTNKNIVSRFFARTPKIWEIVRICYVDQFLRKLFWFFKDFDSNNSN